MTDQAAERPVAIEKRDHYALVTIDRASRMNALSIGAMQALVEAVDELGRDADVRAIVVTGAGDRAFCAGADLKEADELAKQGKSFPHPMTGLHRNVFEAVLECRKPTIAAINGVALGAGMELALACDIRFAVDGAELGLPEALRGMGANFGSVLLPRLVPRAIALDLLYTGRSIEPHEAVSIGLINRVFPRESFLEEVANYAALVAANAPLTLQRYKQMALKGWEMGVHAALRLDVGPNPYASEDRIEGVRAFIEKRKPNWQGK